MMFKQRRLPAAGRPEQDDDLAGADLKVDAAQGRTSTSPDTYVFVSPCAQKILGAAPWAALDPFAPSHPRRHWIMAARSAKPRL